MKHDEEEMFWQDLRRHLAAAEEIDAVALAEAEKALQGAEPEPMSAEAIDRIVSSVTGASRRSVRPAPAGRRSWLRAPSFGRAAAMIGGAILLLSAGMLVRVVLWPESRNSTQTLAFGDAIQIAVDNSDDPERRRIALNVVYQNIRFGIDTLGRVEGEGGEIGAGARLLRSDLRRKLLSGTALSIVPEQLPKLLEFILRMEDKGLGVAKRRDAMEALSKHLTLGIQTLHSVRYSAALPELKAEAEVYVGSLTRLVSDSAGN